MRCFRALMCCVVSIWLTGCLPAAEEIRGQTVGEVVTNIVKYAAAGDGSHFTPIFEPASKVPALIGMIQRSGMLTNYSERLETQSTTNARLDYHCLERRCNFQVELQKADQTWKVTRIWLCR